MVIAVKSESQKTPSTISLGISVSSAFPASMKMLHGWFIEFVLT
jgi:hypothetical protein